MLHYSKTEHIHMPYYYRFLLFRENTNNKTTNQCCLLPQLYGEILSYEMLRKQLHAKCNPQNLQTTVTVTAKSTSLAANDMD